MKSVALDYVANSDIINFLNSLDLNLDVFFQALWRHVLLIEYIKLRFNVSDEGKSKSVFDGMVRAFSKNRKMDVALEYLRGYHRKFWISADESAREIAETLEGKVNAELGGEIKKFKGNAGYARTLTKEKRASIKQRAKKFIDSKLLAEQAKVLDLLKEYDKSKKSARYYILIDGLDDDWVDESIRYQLIRALIESQKAYGKIRNLKLIVTIRADIFERVLQETDTPGSQRDKYNDYLNKISWSADQLYDLINLRIDQLYKKKYTTDNVEFNDVFPQKIGTVNSFEYIIKRTLMRPRDVILFLNEIFREASGLSTISPSIVKSAEKKYSRLRHRALIDEWKSSLPSIELMLGLLSSQKSRVSISALNESSNIDDIVLKLSESRHSKYDPIINYIAQSFNGWTDRNEDYLLRLIASELYRTGAIGLKLSNSEKHSYSYKDSPVISPIELSSSTKLHILPFLHPALNINNKAFRRG